MLAVSAVAEEAEEPTWDVEAPPGEMREVSIDTTTGTWMSLDVSPDASTIAFDLLGGTYFLPIAGGEATRINSSLS